MLTRVQQIGSERGVLEERMLQIRLLENRLQELCLLGEAGDLHFSKGQEAICVGVCAALRETDYVVAHHRTIAHAVAKGVPLRPLIAELLGKAEGMNGGMAGEMHMSYLPARFMFSFQLVGTCVSVAAGIAWAVQNHLKADDIVAVFHGDAVTSNAQWHEGVNLAAVHHLPLLLICENNHLAGNVRPQHYLPVEHIAQRAAAYGIEAETVDGNNVLAVKRAAERAVQYVRLGRHPFLLVCETARLGRHKQGMGDLRTKEEMATLALGDPLRDAMADAERSSFLAMELGSIIESVRSGPDPRLPRREKGD